MCSVLHYEMQFTQKKIHGESTRLHNNSRQNKNQGSCSDDDFTYFNAHTRSGVVANTVAKDYTAFFLSLIWF